MKKANKLLIRIWNNNKIVLTYQVTVYRRFHSIFYSDISKNQTSSENRLMKLINTSSEKELDMACQILELVRKF